MKIFAAALAGACLATSPLFAADLFGSAPPPMPEQNAETELGANWYIRGDLGYGQNNQATVVPQAGLFPQNQTPGGYIDNNGRFQALVNPINGKALEFNGAPIGDPNTPVQVQRGNNFTVGAASINLGFGYRVNDWLRVEAQYSFFKGPGLVASTKVYCPGGVNAVSNYSYASAADTTGTASPVGYTYDWSTCNGYLNLTQKNNLGLAAAYVDLGHWGMFTPYIGGGMGVNVNEVTGSLNYYNTTSGQAYTGPSPTGTAPANWVVDTGATDQAGRPIYSTMVDSKGNTSNINLGKQSWARTIDQTKWTFAAQAAAGLGIQISQSATLDIGYRLLTTDITSGAKGIFQSVNMGVRYNLN